MSAPIAASRLQRLELVARRAEELIVACKPPSQSPGTLVLTSCVARLEEALTELGVDIAALRVDHATSPSWRARRKLIERRIGAKREEIGR